MEPNTARSQHKHGILNGKSRKLAGTSIINQLHARWGTENIHVNTIAYKTKVALTPNQATNSLSSSSTTKYSVRFVSGFTIVCLANNTSFTMGDNFSSEKNLLEKKII